MSIQNDDFANIVREEAFELLEELEDTILELETDPGNMDYISQAFRALHSIKGSGSMAGFDALSGFTHGVENIFDRVRSGTLDITKDLLTCTLEAKDHIQNLLGAPPEGTEELDLVSKELMDRFKAVVEGDARSEGGDSSQAQSEERPKVPGTWWVRYRPAEVDADLDLEAVVAPLAEMGNLQYLIHAQDAPVSGMDAILTTDYSQDDLADALMALPKSDVEFHKILDQCVRGSDLPVILETVVKYADKDPVDLAREIGSNYAAKVSQRGRSAADKPAADTGSIRVDSMKLDTLVDMVGELVILQSRLTQAVNNLRNPVLTTIAEDLERLSDEMRDKALSIRMLPIGTAFGLFKRLIRDLSASLGKDVDFVTEGAETELDKTVIDRLKDPIMHILRNSMDHGFESPEARISKGKPGRGTLKLTAGHASGEVVLTISDDGSGIDAEAVRAKAVDRGLLAPDAEVSDAELFSLIFEPGFSTAKQVTGVSGRGVGMDVVKRGIDALRGHIDLSSEKGVGTTLSIRLPLTLAIIDGLMVRIGEESFIIPLSLVDSCQERFLEPDQAKEMETIDMRGKLVPCVSLRKLLSVPGDQPGYERIIIVSVEGMFVGLTVDFVVGRQQAVIKNLGHMLEDLQWVSGTTINGDGGISLILDVQQIVRYASRMADSLEA